MKLLYCPKCGGKLFTKKEDDKERLFCQRCKEFIYENPVPVVAAVILDKEKRILLVKRGEEPCTGRWALPSGFIEIDEIPEESVIREMREEVNLNCRIRSLLGLYQQRGWRYKSVIVLAYILDVIKGNAKAGDDAVDLRYFDYQNLPEIPFKSHREIIEDIFKGSDPIVQ